MKIIFSYMFVILSLGARAQSTPKEESSSLQKSISSSQKNMQITYKIIEDTNHTFGYDIIADNRLLIHQPTIPCLPGSSGFKNKTDARKVVQLVISKINKGVMPPTVTVEEMQNLNIHLN